MIRKWILFVIILLVLSFFVGWLRYMGILKMPFILGERAEPTIEALEGVATSFSPENRYSDWMGKLGRMENCGEGIIDINGLVSKGKFCFQRKTYLHFVKRYEIYPYAEEQELLSNWGDSYTQEEIVKKIIEEDKNLLAIHWVLSVRKIGLPQ